MRSWIGVSWVVVAALGWVAFGCGSSSSDASGGQVHTKGGAGGEGGVEWLPGEDDNPFVTPESGPADLQAPTSGGGTGMGGSGGAGGTAPPSDPLDTLCPQYDPTAFSHTLTATARDPGNTASATRARELLGNGKTPVPGSVRATDFVNYYAKSTPANVTASTLGGVVELRTRKINGTPIPTQLDLYVGVVAGAVTRPEVVLTVIVDSTLTPSALTRAKATVAALGKGLKANDQITLMSADPSIDPVAKVLSADAANEVAQLAEQLTLGGGSIAQRLPQAYASAKAKTSNAGSWNRIVVISDGEEDADAPDYALIDSEAANAKIFLTAIGVSPESTYGDALLYRLSHQGRGRYLYVDGVNEPAALFAERFDEIFGFARDKVRIRVDMPKFMRALDPDPVGGGGSPRDRYLAPGEWARFVFHLSICSKDVLVDPTYDVQLVTVTVESTLPDGQDDLNPLVMKSLPVKKAPYNTAPELDKLLAIQAFVDALKYPMVSRFDEAKAQLGALPTSPGPELLTLLSQHPAFPQQ